MVTKQFALIMAGGQGTRFWPWSTAARPKQFLPVVGEQPLLTQTYRRLARFLPEERIYIIAEARYWKPTSLCLPGFPKARYIVEPVPRNTAPSLVWANIVLSRIDPGARLLVVPADHYIPDEEVYASQMKAALVQAGECCIVTAGIPPTHPHTGYGYIHFDPSSPTAAAGEDFFRVLEFKEKPDRETAQRYLEQGGYCWNAGMFLYRLDHFRGFLEQYAPYYFQQYQLLEKAKGRALAGIFDAIRPDSIDYALMEKVKETRMLKARFFWNDVGSWSSLMEIGDPDGSGNVTRGGPILLQAKKCLVYAMGEKPVAVIGLEQVAIVDTPEGLIVSAVSDLQRIKEVFPKLEQKKK